IGCELAQSFSRLGSRVSIVSDGDAILPREDRDAVAILIRQFERENVVMVLGAKIQRAELAPEGKGLVFDRGHGPERISGDEILVAVGRTPNVEELNLEAAGVRYDKKGITVDDHLRTSSSHIFAAGDIDCNSLLVIA